MTTAAMPEVEVPTGRITSELAKQIHALSRESKEQLVILLQEDLDGGPFIGDLPEQPADDPAAVKSAWKEELARRIEDVRSGRVQAIDGYESLARIQKKLREKYGT